MLFMLPLTSSVINQIKCFEYGKIARRRKINKKRPKFEASKNQV